MGDPVGIGPELICLALNRPEIYKVVRPLVIGDVRIMEASRKVTGTSHMIASINIPGAGRFKPGCIDVLNISNLDLKSVFWGHPTLASGRAMIDYINPLRVDHIITIEVPIEYLHRDKKSIVNQREVGQDTNAFSNALRGSL